MATTNPRQTVFTGPVCPANPEENGEVFVHLVLFKMYGSATEKDRDTALRLMVEMCDDADGIVKYELAESMDTRKGTILSEKIIFTNEGAFEAFKATEGHHAYASFIRKHADWIISDYYIPTFLI